MLDRTKYLNKIADDCKYELERLHIPISPVTEFKINTRATARFGQCSRISGGFSIDINYKLCDGMHEDGLKNTIYHELLHTCPDCNNHGREWKRLSKIVEDKLGQKISRMNSWEEKGFATTGTNKYVFKCMSCGRVLEYKRNCKAVRMLKCRFCGGTLTKL